MKDEKKFAVGQYVKIIEGAPCTGHVFTDDVGKIGKIVSITDLGWKNPDWGQYGYEVQPDEETIGLFYPFTAIERIDNGKR